MAILLVIPCLRERARLPHFLPRLCAAVAGMPVWVRVVDDGSGAEEQAWLAEATARWQREFPALLPLLSLPVNEGKGGAVYAGWDVGTPVVEWLGFVDADGAVPPEEVARLCRLVLTGAPGRALYAERTGTDGTQVIRERWRALSGAVFRLLVRVCFRFPVRDTQCGCKFLPARVWPEIRRELRERRFVFDVELTQRLVHCGVRIDAAAIDWKESPGTRLRLGSVGQMMAGLLRLRCR